MKKDGYLGIRGGFWLAAVLIVMIPIIAIVFSAHRSPLLNGSASETGLEKPVPIEPVATQAVESAETAPAATGVVIGESVKEASVDGRKTAQTIVKVSCKKLSLSVK